MKARLSPRRLLIYAAALATLAVLTSGCGGGTDAQAARSRIRRTSSTRTPSSASATRRRGRRIRSAGTASSTSARWSTSARSRCTIRARCRGTRSPAASRVGRLQPGGVLVTWNASNPPAVGLGQGGSRIRVGGHPARRVDTAGGMCRSIGADRTIDVLIQTRPLPVAAHGVHRVPARAGAGASRAERRRAARVHEVPLAASPRAPNEGPGRTRPWSGLEFGSAVENRNQTGADMHGIHRR